MQSTPFAKRDLPAIDGRRYGTRLFTPSNDSNWRRILATSEYLNALTPPINNLTNVTTLDYILMRSIPKITSTWYPMEPHFSNSSATLVPFIEHIISTLVVDGIARTGSHLQRSPVKTLQSLTIQPASAIGITKPENGFPDIESTTSMRMDTTVQGYAYVLYGFPSYLATAILSLHILIALSDTIWILWTRRTSSAWDCIPELIVLAQNSIPAAGPLENTEAGIRLKETFAATAKIAVTQRHSEERLELVWTDQYEDGDKAMLSGKKVMEGRAY
jgi:hypothetical protein